MATILNADTVVGGAVVTGDASGVLALQAAGSTQVTINGSGVVLANPLPVGSGGTGATSLSGITAGSATNLAGGSAGTVPYQSASGTTAMLAAGTSGQFLQSNGASAPTWATPSGGVTSVATSGGLTGGTITSTGTLSIDTNNSVGVGAYAFITTAPGSSNVNDGATTAGSNLLLAYGNGSGSWAASQVAPSGTWRNVTGFTISGNGNGYGLFIRTA